MNRRSFIESILVSVAAPSLFLPKITGESPWKKRDGIWITNPDWLNATFVEYPLVCIGHARAAISFENLGTVLNGTPFPRIKWDGHNWIRVPQYIKA